MNKSDLIYRNQKYNGFILIKNHNDMIDFRNETTYGMMKESATSLLHRGMALKNNEKIDKESNDIVKAIEKTDNGKGLIYQQSEMMASYMINQDKAIDDGLYVIINPINKLSYFTAKREDVVITNTKKVKYSIDDIIIKQWKGGTHWYAKIDNIDVVIDGEQKWNAMWVAKEKAIEFLKTL